jgi:NAD(P)H-dependent FMN reductase
MITIISATDRPGSNTLKIAKAYSELLHEKNLPHQLLSLEDVSVFKRDESFQEMESQFLISAQKFIFVTPEYNGSYAGILKLMIDRSDISKCWHHKKALLTGVATGRAGNLRGMEHLTGTLLYLKMNVHHNRLPISQVDKLLDITGKLVNEDTLKVVNQQIEDFITF